MTFTPLRCARLASVLLTALASLVACGGGVASTLDGASNPSGCSSDPAKMATAACEPGGQGRAPDRNPSSSGGATSPPSVCSYPVNPPGCPPTFTTLPSPTSCGPIGLKCGYPGSADGGTADDCSFAAQLVCSPADAGSDGDDGGVEAGAWTSSAP